jgi:hypothetical protein
MLYTNAIAGEVPCAMARDFFSPINAAEYESVKEHVDANLLLDLLTAS